MAEMYQQLATDYHLFFPARQGQLEFITRATGDGACRILDVGSGTGEYVSALVQRGYSATGIEIEEAMHRQALDRHAEILNDESGDKRLLLGDMIHLEKHVTGPFKLVYCIGNTLSHLPSESDVASVIDAMWKLTRPDGAVLIQLTNFDHVLKSGYLVTIAGQQRVMDRDTEPAFVFDMPTLTATREDSTRIEFARQLLMRRAADMENPESPPEKLIFHTTLNTGQREYENYTPMVLLTAERLKFCLPRDAGRTWYGDFNGAEWTEDSPASIILLR